MSAYRIGNETVAAIDPRLPRLLAGIHGQKARPVCLCRTPGVDMYVAKINGSYIIKRMPNTGKLHAATCDSYEPPPELSGLGEVAAAIQENPEEGLTTLKLDFSLSKIPGRKAPSPSTKDSASAKTDGTKLTLRGVLHYLWDQAGFSRWTPAMAGKRSWYVLHKYLVQAAAGKETKGNPLADLLYIPESFSLENKEQIAQRRRSQMLKISAPEKGARRLMMLIAEVKEIAASRYGHKIIVKHLPDFHFMMNDDLHARLTKIFEAELALWSVEETSHLIVAATFGVGETGFATLEEVALMIVSENWIPFEHSYDKQLIDALTANHRPFIKGLRYNLARTRPLACAVLSDTLPHGTALYIVPPGADDNYQEACDELITESDLNSWVWRAGDETMPPLPANPNERSSQL